MGRCKVKIVMILAEILLAGYLCGCGTSDDRLELETDKSRESEEQTAELSSGFAETELKAQLDNLTDKEVNTLDGVTTDVFLVLPHQ